MQSLHALAHELDALKRERPRKLYEDQKLRIRFRSVNYDLLLALLGHVNESSKASLFDTIVTRIGDPTAFARAEHPLQYPYWNPFVSELPLIAELCVRHGQKATLFHAISLAESSPAILILLLQLEDMLSFNFNLFSEEELKECEAAIDSFIVLRQSHPRRDYVGQYQWKNGQRSHLAYFWQELDATCKSVKQECRRGQYLYLKGHLLKQTNLEVNQDKEAVVGFLQSLAFNPTLIESLEKSEELYRTASSPFDLKSSMSHLRSFLENLHIEAAGRVAAKSASARPSKWGQAILLLRQQNILTEKEEDLVSAFYTVVSDNAIHPLIAEREYARLMRNIAIEYGLLLLSKLEKANV